MVRGGLMILNKSGEPYYVLGKKFSNSTLKSMTKDKLIECLDVAQHNYEWVNERLFNATQYAEKLDEALDKACDTLTNYNSCNIDNIKLTNDGDFDCNFEKHDCKKCWRDYLMKGEKE